jgi:murein DD-endopeptidase MepM/ murein hydrolase activator NlpD
VATSANAGDRSYGQYITIIHADNSRSLYAHLSSRLVGLGDIVKTGQKIGISGYSGGVRPPGPRGAHLHFELGFADARAMMARRGVALATGGVVRSTPGGVMAMLGEGGKHERVEPLDSQGMSARDYALINALAAKMGGGSGGPTYVKVFIGETELTDIVRYEISDTNKTLARDLRIGKRRR